MFGAQQDPSRTEKATPKRVNKQRSEGNVPKAPELGKAVSLLGGVVILYAWIGPMADNIKRDPLVNDVQRKAKRFGVEVQLVEYESCLKLDYVIYDSHSGRKLTRASTTHVAVRLDNGEMQFQTPDSWQRAVKHYLAAQAA